jgi:RimJ/RimL family protein N-acetyltransferase
MAQARFRNFGNVMVEQPVIETERLILRPWRDSDLEPFTAMNRDPRVMEFMPKPLTREESDGWVARIRAHFIEHGYGLWAVETSDAPFIGFIGLQWANFEADFTPQVEVGFRLIPERWGKGLATEGGKAAVAWAFANTDLPAIYSWTARLNLRSQSAIRKIGLTQIGEFDHPRVAEDHPLRPHLLFRIQR